MLFRQAASVARRVGHSTGLASRRCGTRAPVVSRQQCCASTLVLAEHNNTALGAATLSTVTAAVQLSGGGEVHGLVLGSGSGQVATQLAQVEGVDKVLHGDDAAFEHGLAENLAAAVAKVQQDGSYSHVLIPSTMQGKSYVGRLGALLDVAPVTDVVEIVDESTFKRPMYAGNALATVSAGDSVKVLSVRGTAFDKAARGGAEASIEAAPLLDKPDLGLSSFVSEAVGGGERPDLTAARVVISGGRGLKEGSNFAMLEVLADKLGGAVGASRAAVDAGMVPNELQVGQTGKVVAPELYVAVGISGAIQHLSGMKDSKCIVAINKDKEAPIFQVADYGLVADLFDAVPEITGKV